MTLPEIVIEEPRKRWPAVLVFALYVVALAPVVVLAYINLFFAGIFGGPHLALLVVIPAVWFAGLLVTIVWSSRRVAAGLIGLGLLLVLAVVDAALLMPVFAP